MGRKRRDSFPGSNKPMKKAFSFLPRDYKKGTFVGRIQTLQGPSLVALSKGSLYDITSAFPTCSHLIRTLNPTHSIQSHCKTLVPMVGNVDSLFENTKTKTLPHLLSPNDIQSIKAAGVTFATSLIERVIEEQAQGDPTKSHEIRTHFQQLIGSHLSNVKPGSKEAHLLKKTFQDQNLWSQYLEVGLMEDCELFTKAQPMSAVGFGASVGILRKSTWNNPEPEIVLVINPKGEIVGVTLGNDVNLRDIEGRSALLLGKAKDNNASCSIGPLIRLLDESYTLDDVRKEEIRLEIKGQDGFQLEAISSMKHISRDITELSQQTLNENHNYPDSLVLFVGTMFSPTMDRDLPGKGFTHKPGDIVTISSDRLGTLMNTVQYCDEIPPWTFGIVDLMQNLSKRHLL
jgi:fumarylacetoacetate (FAA) hydrolase family protein